MSVQRTLSPVPERRKRGSWTVVVRRTNASEEVRVTTKTGDEDVLLTTAVALLPKRFSPKVETLHWKR